MRPAGESSSPAKSTTRVASTCYASDLQVAVGVRTELRAAGLLQAPMADTTSLLCGPSLPIVFVRCNRVDRSPSSRGTSVPEHRPRRQGRGPRFRARHQRRTFEFRVRTTCFESGRGHRGFGREMGHGLMSTSVDSSQDVVLTESLWQWFQLYKPRVSCAVRVEDRNV